MRISRNMRTGNVKLDFEGLYFIHTDNVRPALTIDVARVDICNLHIQCPPRARWRRLRWCLNIFWTLLTARTDLTVGINVKAQ